MKEFWKENRIFILILSLMVIIFNIHLPYYIMAPGGTINITERVKTDSHDKLNGSLNLLYVSQLDGNVATFLMAKILPNWDIMDLEELKVSDETTEEIHDRDKIMLKNATNNAKYVAYNKAGKKITVKKKQNIVLATTKKHDGSLKVGDVIIKADGVTIENFDMLKEVIRSKKNGEKISMDIIRNGEEEKVKVGVYEEEESKLIGAVIITDYDYELDPEIELKFKSSEAGASGGLMTTLTIYANLVDEDILKGRKIAGTGTIDMEGNVGEIDGIKYKIMGANKNKVDLVLVPEGNYEEAMKVKKKNNYKMDIVKVETFDDALEYLEKNS